MLKAIQGFAWFKGTQFGHMPSPPGNHVGKPRPSSQFPELDPYTDPNGTWSLPTTYRTVPASNADPEYGPGWLVDVSVYSPGGDGTLGTADDVLERIQPVEASGFFGFVVPSDGQYRVVVATPPDPDFTSSWSWEYCSVKFKSSNPAVPDDQQGYKPLTPLVYDVTISEANPVKDLMVKFEGSIGLVSHCQFPEG